MKVYYSLDDFTPVKNAVVTTGTFDGVHLGHKKILSQLHQVAQTVGGESVLLTFFPHPRMVLQPDMDLKLINSRKEKIELLQQTGLDHLIVHPFTKDFSRTTSLDFVRNILVNGIGAKKLVIGYDHHFGRNREGSFEHLKEFGPVYGFDVEEISAQDLEDVTISSTKIRQALSEGDLTIANSYLGYHFPLSGKIVQGEKMGHQLGYPTANVIVDESYKIIPADGVYVIKVHFPSAPSKEYRGMCNIGKRPTFNGTFKTIEAHLFNFNEDVYGEQITLSFIKRLRTEVKFESPEQLKEQLQKDEEDAKMALGMV